MKHLLTVKRYLLAVVVIVADTALLVAGHPGLPPWVVPVYASVVTLVIVVGRRVPTARFVVALVLASVTGSSFALLLWSAYLAGHSIVSRSDTAKVIGAALGCLAVQLAGRPADRKTISALLLTYVVFVALPLLVGRYLAQHGRLVAALNDHNRQLRRERELLAERARLHERLRIARDMHDSLGHRLSLVSVQAAALEVTELPPRQRQAILRLAGTTRDAMNELSELVGTLRGNEDADAPGIEAIGEVVAEFGAAGMPVAMRRTGEPRRLSAAAGQAAYRVIQEGLTNAAKHATSVPVTVAVEWEPDALLLTVTNHITVAPAVSAAPAESGVQAGSGVSAGSAEPRASATAAVGGLPSGVRPGAGHGPLGGGSGLIGLDERVRLAGGFLDRKRAGGEHRLVAMLPVAATIDDAITDDNVATTAVGRGRAVALGFAVAVLMFVVLPASMLVGVR